MRRADRLFLLIQALRGRRVVTARRLAELLEVSERTVYRDVQDLQLSGVPIEGEAGVGYALRRGSDIPPLMFTRDELEALVVGARMVQAWTGRHIASSARQALTKIEAVLPEELKRRTETSRVFVPPVERHAAVAGRLDELHASIEARRVEELDYRREDGQASVRAVAACVPGVLGHGVDAGRLVRDAQRLPQLPSGPHRGLSHARSQVRRDAGDLGRRLPAQGRR